MKLKLPAMLVFVLSLFVSGSAWAQAKMYSISAPSTIPDPLAGFTVNYTLGGSKYGVGAASAELRFYISASANGSTGVALLYSQQVSMRGSGWGPYYPPSGTQSVYISRWNMPSNTVALMQSISDACAPQRWYILGELDWTGYQSAQTMMGTTKLPDFYFTGGTISPSTIQPGGTTYISFDLYTRCPANSYSRVGIYLANSNYQLIGYIGHVSIASGAGTSSLPPSAITFSPSIAPGTYYIVLFADDDGWIAESNENNNVGSFRLDITPFMTAAAANDDGAAPLEQGAKSPVEVHSARRSLQSGASRDYIQEVDRNNIQH